jgi:hypothetical protein
MAIYNLGNSGEPNESILADASKYSGELRKRREDSVIEAKKIVYKDKLDRAEATRKNLRDTVKNYWSKPADQRALFDNSDQGKQWQKLVKSNLPEAFDDDGKLVPLPSEEKAYAPKTQEEAVAFKVNTEAGIRKLRANSPLTPAEAAAIGNFATNAQSMGLMEPDQAKKLVGLASKYLQQNNYSGNLSSAPQASDDSDPLGIL